MSLRLPNGSLNARFLYGSGFWKRRDAGDTEAPTKPGELVASDIEETTLTLTWGASTDNVGVLNYRVEQAVGAGAFAWLATVAAPTVTLAVTGLTDATAYRFRVLAEDAAGNQSDWEPDADGLLVTTVGFVAPSFVGDVHAMVEDGDGGYIVGGGFTSVTDSVATYGVGYTRLVRLTAAGLVDPDWSCPVTGDVLNLLVHDGKLYVGGSFAFSASVGGVARNRIARVDITTATVDSWYPTGGANNPVHAFAVHDGKLYVGGVFTSIGGWVRNRIARVTTGATATVESWYPSNGANWIVYTLAVHDGKLYVGGDFWQIGGVSRNRIAQLATGATATVESWYPTGGAGGTVLAFAVHDGKLYVGGQFEDDGWGGPTFGGEERDGLARVDIATATVESWYPHLGYPPGVAVRGLAVHDGKLYVGGKFVMMGGVLRSNIAVANIADASVTTLNPNANGAWDADLRGFLFPAGAVNRVITYGRFTAIANHKVNGGVKMALLSTDPDEVIP